MYDSNHDIIINNLIHRTDLLGRDESWDRNEKDLKIDELHLQKWCILVKTFHIKELKASLTMLMP